MKNRILNRNKYLQKDNYKKIIAKIHLQKNERKLIKIAG